jgi:K(+)-stimulated pyrophosphate-energized sodium pump
MFGIAMASVGMMSIVGMIISNDAYGPIVDNARGLVEMGDLGEDALTATDELDSAGNTVKAVTKGFSIAAAGLTVISLLGAFISEVNMAAEDLGIIAAGETLINYGCFTCRLIAVCSLPTVLNILKVSDT